MWRAGSQKAVAKPRASDCGCSKWVERYRSEGSGWFTRSLLEDIGCIGRRLRRWSPRSRVCAGSATQASRCGRVRVSRRPSAVSAAAGAKRLAEMERRTGEPLEREHPGELIGIDIKKLGRFKRVGHRISGDGGDRARAGASVGSRPRLYRRRLSDRLAEMKESERKASAVAFLKGAVIY